MGVKRNFYMERKDRLKAARDSLGMTQADFGMLLGLNAANVRDLESGKVKISTLHAIAIEKTYGIAAGFLLGLTDEMLSRDVKDEIKCESTTVSELHAEYTDPVAKAFLKDWLTLPDVVKMRVWVLVKEELEKMVR